MRFLQLTPLTSDFLPDMLRLDRQCFGGLWSKSAYERELESPNSLVVGLVQPTTAESPLSAPRLLAMGCLWAICEEAHVTILAVDRHHRRQGMGQALLGSMLSWAQQRGQEWATLEVGANNRAAIAVYGAFGFTEVGRRRGYYADTGEDALILWRNGLQEPQFVAALDQLLYRATTQLNRQGWTFQQL